MSKPSTPVRRSKVGPGRPGSAGGEIPLTASMEVLTPDPCVPPHLPTAELGRSHELYAAPNGPKPRTPGSANLVRTRSTDGRRVSGPAHEIIPLISTASKSLSANHIIAQPLLLAATAGASPASSILGTSCVGLPPPQSPYTAGPAYGGTTPAGCSSASASVSHAAMTPGARSRSPLEVAFSTASSRFNPVVEDDDDMPPLSSQQQQEQQLLLARVCSSSGVEPQQVNESARESQVVALGGGAAAVAQRAAAAAGSGITRRYVAAESVSLSQQQQQVGESGAGAGDGEGEEVSGGGGGGRLSRLQQDNSELPGTPASVASGRVGGVFFTGLQRSFGGAATRPSGVGDSQDLGGVLAAGGDGEGADGDGDSDGDEDGHPGSRASRQGRISAVTSRLNPMQSPTMSEDGEDDDEGDDSFAKYAGEEALRSAEAKAGSGGGDGSGDAVEEAGDGRASTSAPTDYTNPVQTPYDSRLSTPLLLSAAVASEPSSAPPTASESASARKSLLLVIRDLYVTESEPQAPAEPSRPATATSEQQQPSLEVLADAEADVANGLAGTDGASDALAASRAAVATLAAQAESQQFQRRSELGEYMTSLQELKDESGGRLVELPADWGVMLERLLRQRRAEFATLQGWMGPRRFEDLPINQLPTEHPDPRVEEGLARIRELDAMLNDKLIAALISHRETFPDQWAEQERKRLERHTKGVEEALKRERQKRLRAARIARAVTSLDGPAALAASPSAQGSARSLAGGPHPSSIYSRLFTLKPEEEALVEAILQRNDEEGAAVNPFDLESAATFGSMAEGVEGPAGGAGMSFADPDDIDLDLDMFLPSASASTCPTPSAAAPMPRPLSARLTEADGGGDGGALRPLSAMSSSYSSSRPGTSSGPAGGLSPLAAAALHGHPVLLAAGAGGAGLRASATGSGSGGGGLLPEHMYDDPRVAARALRAINARLAAFESEHLWDESGALADFKFVTFAGQQQQQQQQDRKQQPLPEQPDAEASKGPGPAPANTVSGAGAGPQSSPSGRVQSPPRSVRSAAGGPAISVSNVSVTAGGKRDYLREERLAKELAMRERDVDAALRSLKTGTVVRLGEATLKALVEQCKRLQELNEHRRKIEEAEAAARRAQLQRQQLLASRASEPSGSPKGTPKGASAPSISGGSSRGQAPSPATATSSSRAGAAEASIPTDAGAAATGRGGKPPTGASATSGSPGNGGANGGANAAPGTGNGGAMPRQNSAGKSRSGTSSATFTGGQAPAGQPSTSRRTSDPAVVTSGSSAPSTSASGGGVAGRTKGGKAAVAAVPASASAPSFSSESTEGATPKPRSAGKAVGSSSPIDGGGGLPPPPPPPPPPP